MLNEAQETAVRYLDGPLLVLAGAGSGKTRVITQKIHYLIQECGLKPNHITAVTFTNKAAREMKERVSLSLKGKEARGLKISTFHHWGLQFLRKESNHVNLKSHFSIFDPTDALGLIKELAIQQTEAADAQIAGYMQCISRWKGMGLAPSEAINHCKDAFEATAARLYPYYQKHLQAYNAVDFDDLIYLPLKILEENSGLQEKWQNLIRYLLIDEYQDTNATQYALIRHLVGVRAAFTVVGDDQQSVYAWRGARPENLRELQKDYPQLQVIKLEQNYRSTGIILRTANKLIANNSVLFEKKLWSALGPGEQVRILWARNEEHEAERVTAQLLSHKFQNRTEFQDYAIFYRSNHQARVLEKTLREHQIPYRLSGGTSFFSKTEVKDILAYLKVLVNPDDDCAFLRIVNTPKREIGPSSLEKLGCYAKSRELSLFAASFEMGLEVTLNGKPLEKLRELCHWLNLVADNAKRGDTMGVIRDMVKAIDYYTYLMDESANPKAGEKRIENLESLLEWLARMLKEEGENLSLSEALNKIMLMDMLDRQQDQDQENAVQLMTLHTSKGLEFPHVFIIGFEEGILPHETSVDEGNIEEERRLCYVGITRAQKTLTLSLSQERRRHSENLSTTPSRFLEEITSDDLLWDGFPNKTTPEEEQSRAKSHLAAIRGLLNK